MPKLTSPRRTKEQASLNKLRTAFKKAIKQSKDDAIAILKSAVEEQLVDNDLVATGDLLKSVDSDLIEIDAFGFALNIGTLDAAAVYVEEGRGAGEVPLGEISRWMEARGIEEKALFPIYRKIKERGFYTGRADRGKHPFEKASEIAAPHIEKVVYDNLDRLIEGASDKVGSPTFRLK